MARKKTEEPAFEPAIHRLEEIVRALEGGALTLEESLALFEEGVGLSRRCLSILNAAEHKVEKLVGQTGETEPFDMEADNPSGEAP